MARSHPYFCILGHSHVQLRRRCAYKMHATTQVLSLPNNPKYAVMIEKFKPELDLPQHHVTSPPLHKRSPLTVNKKQQLHESLIIVLPTTPLQSSSSPSRRFNFYPAKNFVRHVRFAVAIFATALLLYRIFSRIVAFVPPIATYNVALNLTGDDQYHSKNEISKSMYSSVQPIADAVVLTNTTNDNAFTDVDFGKGGNYSDDVDKNVGKIPDPSSNNEDSEGAIVILLNH
jgi:hypothetical protein